MPFLPQGGVWVKSSSSGGPPLERGAVVIRGVWGWTGGVSNEAFLLGGLGGVIASILLRPIALLFKLLPSVPNARWGTT